MKKIALIAVLAGIALVVNAQEQGKEVKPSPTTSPEKPGSVSIQAGTTTEAPKKTEKPYGCYKDLKWGMSFEQAQSSLGNTLKKGSALIGPLKGKTLGDADITIGDKIYFLRLMFDSTGLYRVQIDPKNIAPGGILGKVIPADQMARILIDAYFLFRPTLEEKFGKPIKESAQDRGSDVVFVNNLLAHQAILSSTWETEESNINLTAEIPEVIRKQYVPDIAMFSPFLVYEKKNAVPKAKVDL